MVLSIILNPKFLSFIVKIIQAGLQVLASLGMTNSLFPSAAIIQDGRTFDYIIVGGGAAGCVMANRLTENPDTNVALIEAGPYPPIETLIPALIPIPIDSYVDWKFRSKPDNFTSNYHKGQHFNLAQGKVLGGTSGLSYVMHTRGNPSDYKRWAEVSDDDTWLYDNVLPYFIKMERLVDITILDSPYAKYHGTSGYLGIEKSQQDYYVDRYLDAFGERENIVLDLNGEKYTGYTQPLVQVDILKQNAALSYISSIKHRKNLKIFIETLATRILTEGNKATGVEVLTSDGNKYTLKASKEVIICAGAFNSPKLLMLSGIGPKGHLEEMGIPIKQDLPVGQSLRDRLDILVPLKGQKIPALYVSPLLIPTQYPVCAILGLSAIDKSDMYPDYSVIILATPPSSLVANIACTSIFTLRDDICQSYYDKSDSTDMLFSLVSNLDPKSIGTVSLQSRDPLDPPIIDPGYYTNEEDIENSVDIVSDFIDVLKSKYFQGVDGKVLFVDIPECEGIDKGCRDYLKCYVTKVFSTEYQFSGTCAMGSVLDSKLRVKGFNNLRVVDSSAVPFLPHGQMSPAVMMMAEKISDVIKHCHGEDTSSEYLRTDAENYNNNTKCLIDGSKTNSDAKTTNKDKAEHPKKASKPGLLNLGHTLSSVSDTLSSTEGVTPLTKLTDDLKDGISGIDLRGLDLDLSSFIDLPKYASNMSALVEKCNKCVWDLFGEVN